MNTTASPNRPDENPSMDVVLTLLDKNEFKRETHQDAQGIPPELIQRKDDLIVVERGGVFSYYTLDGALKKTLSWAQLAKILDEYVKVRIADTSNEETNKFTLEKIIDEIINRIPDQLKEETKSIIQIAFNLTKGSQGGVVWGEYFGAALAEVLKDKHKVLNTIFPVENYILKYQTQKPHPKGILIKPFNRTYTLEKLKLAFAYNQNDNSVTIFDVKEDDSAKWTMEELELPEKISVTGMGVDNNRNFLLIGSGHKLIIFDIYSRPIKQVEVLEDAEANFEGPIYCEEDGSVFVGDSQGNLRKILTNFTSFKSAAEKDKEKTAQTKASGEARIALARLRHLEAARKAAVSGPQKVDISTETSPEILAEAQRNLEAFQPQLDSTATMEDIQQIKKRVAEYKKQAQTLIADTKIIEAIFKPLMEAISKKELEIIMPELISEKTRIEVAEAGILNISLDDAVKLKTRIDRLRMNANMTGIDKNLREEVVDLCDKIDEKIRSMLGANEEKLITELDALLEKTRSNLAGFTKLREFEEWTQVDYEQLVDSIVTQSRLASPQQAKFQKRCREIMKEVTKLKNDYAKKFKEKYSEVRAQAEAGIEAQVSTAELMMAEFTEDFSAQIDQRMFPDIASADAWMDKHPLYRNALDMIAAIEQHDPEKARELGKKLKIEIAELKHKAKRMQEIGIDEKTGKQVVVFGNTVFDLWETKEQEEEAVTAELSYKVDPATKGPGISPDQYRCDLILKIKDRLGKTYEVSLHKDETKKYGIENSRVLGDLSFGPSNVTVKEAKRFISNIKDMRLNMKTDVKTKYEEFRQKIRDLNGKISASKSQWNAADGKFPGFREAAEISSPDSVWGKLLAERNQLTHDYHKFLNETGLYVWMKMKYLQKDFAESGVTNGTQGKIPKMSSHWIRDEATEANLELFAQNAEMSMRLQDGMVPLEGHAGTGKDVLVSMFCAETHRPKFTFDCTKWTTEFELSQDVSLAAEGGASYTVKEDSIVVKALQTPGAVLYFNEFNAMPEQAQIFLHSLFDEKRQITLKTSGGKIVKAHPSVIICASMNPGYPGTFTPQFATRSRMIPIKIGYPEFKKADGTYGTSEALRVARSIKSLEDLTIGADLKENEFVALWNDTINKNATNPLLTPERKFDIEVTFGLLTFGNKIREAFIKKMNKSAEIGVDEFTIGQPFTMRELRRCAYVLSHMDASEKQDISKAEETAKNLIRRFYSSYIFDEEESKKLEMQIANWTTVKPTVAP